MSSPLIEGKELPNGRPTYEAEGDNKNRQPQRKVRDISCIFINANRQVTTENDLNKKEIYCKHVGTLQGPAAEAEYPWERTKSSNWKAINSFVYIFPLLSSFLFTVHPPLVEFSSVTTKKLKSQTWTMWNARRSVFLSSSRCISRQCFNPLPCLIQTLPLALEENLKWLQLTKRVCYQGQCLKIQWWTWDLDKSGESEPRDNVSWIFGSSSRFTLGHNSVQWLWHWDSQLEGRACSEEDEQILGSWWYHLKFPIKS